MSSQFPQAFDSDSNLYLVHDALRLRLAEDYNPGDSAIVVQGDPSVFAKFPQTGIITLTEQCSDIQLRALSFNYTSAANMTFSGLTLLPGFTDVVKPKRITDVTQNVMSAHHNQLKDALIAIENFAGIKGDMSLVPLAGTMEARINFLRKLVLVPKAWFTASKHIGITPLCIDFKDFSTREPNTWIWTFGDGTVSVISRTPLIQTGEVLKCYYTPSFYDVTLTVINDFGSDTITFPKFITARQFAPDPATITFVPTISQIYQNNVLRSRINQLITMLVVTSGEQPLDPIISYTWELADDLTHNNSNTAVASYGLGGMYDVKLHTNTKLGAYRITEFKQVIDVVEQFNIWHFIFDPSAPASAVTKTVYAYEFDLLSEVYKAAHTSTALSVTRDYNFLTAAPNAVQQQREFLRNNAFAPRSLTASGDQGAAVVFWAEGAATTGIQQYVRYREFNGFQNTWTTPAIDNFPRQWNWLALNAGSDIFFILGSPGPGAFVGSPTNQTFEDVTLSNYNLSTITFTLANYLAGADELMTNVGGGVDGDFSAYRGTWSNSGFFVRNDGTGSFFRFKSFYMTEGTLVNPLQSIRKMTDMPGATKFEGQMVALSQGIYFFNNTGEVVAYNPVTNTWGVGGPGINSPAFAQLQDTTVATYGDASNTLLAVSDNSTKAYLFFDYSVRAQIRFDETTLTFSSLPVRPSGEQFVAGLY